MATGWLLFRASAPPSARDSDHQPPMEESGMWKSATDLHMSDDRPSWPSWSRGVADPNADEGLSGGDKADGGRGSHASIEGKVQGVESKGETDNVGVKGGEPRSASVGGGREGEVVEHEWPVFGSDGVGGRFGAF